MMKDGGALTHMPHGHPELGSGSEESNNQMLKTSYSLCSSKILFSMTDAEPKVDARRG